jgi:hypothetical protein
MARKTAASARTSKRTTNEERRPRRRTVSSKSPSHGIGIDESLKTESEKNHDASVSPCPPDCRCLLRGAMFLPPDARERMAQDEDDEDESKRKH